MKNCRLQYMFLYFIRYCRYNKMMKKETTCVIGRIFILASWGNKYGV